MRKFLRPDSIAGAPSSVASHDTKRQLHVSRDAICVSLENFQARMENVLKEVRSACCIAFVESLDSRHMSSRSRGSGARVSALLAGALLACSGASGNDLFAPTTSTGTGTCPTNCVSGATTTSGAGGASSTATTSATSSSATSGGGTGTTTSTGAGGSTSGTTTTGAGTTGGSSMGGAPGTGAGGSPVDDAGITPVDDGQVIDVSVIDAGEPDRGGDVFAGRDACVATGMEVCDGLDNNCNGRIDENGVCPNQCIGAAYNGVGYMFCFGNQERIWNDASTECKNHNMHLVRVDDAAQNSFIRKTALSVGYSDTIWLGGSDSAHDGMWMWMDGTQFWQGGVNGHTVDGLYAGWDVGQPNNATGAEDCAAMWTNIEGWHDATCGLRHAFMCQGTPR
jgi:hypothetical protein